MDERSEGTSLLTRTSSRFRSRTSPRRTPAVRRSTPRRRRCAGPSGPRRLLPPTISFSEVLTPGWLGGIFLLTITARRSSPMPPRGSSRASTRCNSCRAGIGRELASGILRRRFVHFPRLDLGRLGQYFGASMVDFRPLLLQAAAHQRATRPGRLETWITRRQKRFASGLWTSSTSETSVSFREFRAACTRPIGKACDATPLMCRRCGFSMRLGVCRASSEADAALWESAHHGRDHRSPEGAQDSGNQGLRQPRAALQLIKTGKAPPGLEPVSLNRFLSPIASQKPVRLLLCSRSLSLAS